MNELFDCMTREELEDYARDGALTAWFADAQSGKEARPRPADSPLGSLESHAAARLMAKSRALPNADQPIIYEANLDTETVIYDLPNRRPASGSRRRESPRLQEPRRD